MARGSISKRTVDATQPSTRDVFLWDDDPAGFGLKVTPAGSKVYIYQYRVARPGAAQLTTPRRYTLGKHGELTPDQARKRAKELAALVAAGTDPKEQEQEREQAKTHARTIAQERERREKQLAFDKMAELWLAFYEDKRTASSVAQAKLVVRNHLKPALGDKPITALVRQDIQPIIDAIPIKREAMRRSVFAYASAMLGWCAKHGYIDANPLASMAKPDAPAARQRVLTDEELIAVWEATTHLTTPYGAFFRLLTLTGQRRGEVAGMNWAELDQGSCLWTVPADRAKNGVAHLVPLSPQAMAEIQSMVPNDEANWPKSGFVLSRTKGVALNSFSQAKSELDAAIVEAEECQPLPAWRVHDLRRTVATGLQRLGIRFEVTEAVLNHVSGAKGGVAGIYQRHDWKEEKRAALNAWAAHIDRIISGAEAGNVIALGARS